MATLNYDAGYDGAPELVHALLTDEAFLNACLDEAGALSRDVRVRRSENAVAVQVTCEVPADGVPPVARSFVGSSVRLDQTMSWRRGADGLWTAATLVDVHAGSRGSAVGEAALRPDPGGTRLQATAQVTVDVPFLGAKLAEMATGFVREGLDRQTAIANRWLAEGYTAGH